MAPLPQNSTARLWIKYTSVEREHELLVRLGSGADAAVASSTATAIATILRDIMVTTDAFIGARFAAAGANISFPVTFTPIAGTVSGTPDPDKVANFVALSGRTSTGRDIKWTFFTPQYDASTLGYRTARAGAVLDFAEYIEDNPALIVGIDGNAPVVNGYANVGFNAYWQRQARRGG